MQKREMAVGIARGVEITARGCPFYNRCPVATEGTCDVKIPPMRELKDGHEIHCHRTIEELEATEKETEKETQMILHGYEKVGEDDPQVHVP